MTQKLTENMTEDELEHKRDEINEVLIDKKDDDLGSADHSADNERKKYIGQHGDSVSDSETAQDVAQPVSDDLKDQQNDLARQEQRNEGDRQLIEQLEDKGDDLTDEQRTELAAAKQRLHAHEVTDSQLDKLKDKVAEDRDNNDKSDLTDG